MTRPCTCTWTPSPVAENIRVCTGWDEECPYHGADSEWWAKTQAYAREVGMRVGLFEDFRRHQ